ncbi:HEAT repeat domain-containing protein [Phycisphaerales bacterium AB-hyl4]|uniref:HEAT repeat domain-containing protein n=1 Tax=Natronomicrosphaera hydrolytica TaxID=3242702 RepID=A0ABV4U559_9BACT
MSAARSLVLGVLLLAFSLALANPSQAQQDRDPAQLWADFNHYSLIARPDLALAAGEALLDRVDDAELLEIVEASDYRDYEPTLERAARVDELREVARELGRRIQQGRVDQSRDEERIREDIRLLGEGDRRFRNATQRLTSAGQYAAPHMLRALQDRDRNRLHPYVVSSLTRIGQPIVDPLAVALPNLSPTVMVQVAQVLADIGYPQPLPYMKQVLEDEQVDEDARRVVDRAYRRLAEVAGIDADTSAADLFLRLGETNYRAATRGEQLPTFDAAENRGIVWEYSSRAGLVPIEVPAPIHGDVLTMRATQRALDLNPDLDAALTLFLAANLRRANRLPDGETDPSYASDRRPPAFYALLAGPVRLHEVLDRALRDNDPALALNAIEALSHTASDRQLVDADGRRQPLLRALSYPDRRVRFRAAEALANARPTESFNGDHRVVPVLAEAVRQQDVQYALVLADDQETLNQLLERVGEQGYEAFGGMSLSDVRDELESRPGVDLVVIAQDTDNIRRAFSRTRDDYKLAATPVLAVARSSDQQARLNQFLGEEARFSSVVVADEPQRLASAIEQVQEADTGEPIGEAESEEFALTALRLLHQIARASDVYDAQAAGPALTQALGDDRDSVVVAAGKVLAELDNSSAQRALASASLDRSGEVQIDLLTSLATSAIAFGNMLTQDHTDMLLEFVDTAEGDTAVAAARAHGALSLPTANAVRLIRGE